MLPAGGEPSGGAGGEPSGGAGGKKKEKMLGWLRCFPHEAVERKAKTGRSAATTTSFRKPKTSSDDCYTSAPRRNRIIRTSSTVIAHGDHHRHSDTAAAAAAGYNHSVLSARAFSFRELAAATGSFREANLIGEGGFGRVYRGMLADGEAVAVKRLDRTGLQGDREFLVEVLVLSGLLSHPNLVGLLGYCADGNQRLLVYNLMPLGSLQDHLFPELSRNTPLSWRTRMRIAHGAAQGLEFLHETASPPVIYRDLKSSNILLDDGYNARLSDFGLARLAPTTAACDGDGHGDGGDKENNSSRVMGTYGYCAPEYVRMGHLTVKSDVYSFGVVLLELITGRRAIDGDRPAGEENLVEWAAPMFGEQRRFHELVDPLLVMRGEGPCGKELKQALAVAAMCLQEEDTVRPIMSDVVMALSFLAADDDFSRR